MQVTVADTAVAIDADRVDGTIERKLEQYLAGGRVVFDEDVDFSALTDFQQRVLREIRAIPYGDTITILNLPTRATNQKQFARLRMHVVAVFSKGDDLLK